MNESLEYLIDLFAVSGGFWLIYAFYNSFRIRRFIVKRYEDETDLLNTVFFREHAVFTRNIPTLISSSMYISHLLMCLWGWRIYDGRKMFRDIKDPSIVTRHFSKKEIRRVKWFAINGLILISHGIAYLVFRSIWPTEFS
jgi:hypothetical protein